MKKYYYKVFIFLLIVFFVLSGKVYSQDTLNANRFTDSPLKKGSWAIVFELGTLLWGDLGYYTVNTHKIENYNFLIKYHLSKKTAIRFNFMFKNISNNRLDYYQEDDYKYFKFGVNANIQYFLVDKYFAKPFLSIGPYYSRSYEKSSYNNSSNYTNNNWDAGVMFTFGVELFVYKNIGMIGEHVIQGTIGNKHSYGSNTFDGFFDNDIYIYKIRANSSRIGFSLYF
jgi:hypothetical protein